MDLFITYFLRDFQQVPVKLIKVNGFELNTIWAKSELGPWQHFPPGSQAICLQTHKHPLGTAQSHLPKKPENIRFSEYRFLPF